VRIDAELVARVARLAALELSAEESEAMSGQLTRIVEHFEALRAIPDELLEASADPAASPLRPDEARDGAVGAFLASNAPELSHGHFVVPRVVTRSE